MKYLLKNGFFFQKFFQIRAQHKNMILGLVLRTSDVRNSAFDILCTFTQS